jgi:hypothetical protein
MHLLLAPGAICWLINYSLRLLIKIEILSAISNQHSYKLIEIRKTKDS